MSSETQLDTLLKDLQDGKYKKVIVMTGAGISTEAGIPDFRSPETGLYSNLQKFNLPYPEAVFDIDYLREHPEAFFTLASEMYPSQFHPTKFHEFIKWISDLGCLKRVYTQNIDTLERIAGVPSDLIVEAHGSFANNHCIDCGEEADKEHIKEVIMNQKQVPKCKKCEGIVKPDIVFFGESLPSRFHTLLETDFDDIDLAIVAGTSLSVTPFSELPKMVNKDATRYLFNLEKVGDFGKRKSDVLILGDLKNNDKLFEKYINSKATESDGNTEAEAESESKTKSETKSEDAEEEHAEDESKSDKKTKDNKDSEDSKDTEDADNTDDSDDNEDSNNAEDTTEDVEESSEEPQPQPGMFTRLIRGIGSLSLSKHT